MADPNITIIPTEVYSDLIKIGIPSLVALAGTIASVVLALKGHNKDILIENLRMEKELDNKRAERKGELISEISLSLTKFHTSVTQYGSYLAAKIETEQLGQIFPKSNREKLSNYYLTLTDALLIGTDIKSKVHLLGNDEVINQFEEYWSSASHYSMSSSPGEVVDYGENLKTLQMLGNKYDRIFSYLSDIYLLKESGI